MNINELNNILEKDVKNLCHTLTNLPDGWKIHIEESLPNNTKLIIKTEKIN